MVLHIRDFIKDEANCTPAFVAAIEALNEGDTLLLDGGTYALYAEGARQETYYISNNDCGVKPIALPLIGKKNITVDGGGAKLIFHGSMLPVVIDRSENVTVKGIKIDYEHPMYAQAEFVSADENTTVLRFDGKDFFCRVNEEGHFCFFCEEEGWEFPVTHSLAQEFDKEGVPSAYIPPYFPYCGEPCDHGFLSGMFHDVKLEQLGENLIAMHGNTGIRHTVGNYFVMTYTTREFPGVFVTDSKDVLLREVMLHHTTSMGVIVQMTENITLDHVCAYPRPGSGRMLAVSADATHFVNCRGKITLCGCKFVHMMDDAVNIHGIYHLYEGQENENTLLLGFGHFQQKGIQPYRPGDRMAVIDSVTNTVVKECCVTAAELLSPDCVRVTVDCAVPAPGEHWVVENLTTAPDVHIYDCESGHNRPRGFLISSAGKVLVERCKFYNMNQGIQLSGEMRDWYESGAIKDVTIRDNDFANSAYAGGVAILIRPQLRAQNLEAPFNGKVVIENNRFVQASRRFLSAGLTDTIVFKGNTFHLDPTLPLHGQAGENGIECDHCRLVEIEDVTEV